MFGASLSQAKKSFFDRQAVIDDMDKATRRVLSRFGAFVRRRARSSIRKRNRISEPGQPPSSHTGILKDFILFGYDPTARSVVIGPTLANMVSFDADSMPIKGTIPEALEYGGQVRTKEVNVGGDRWVRLDNRSRRRSAGRPTRLRTSNIRPRPYMMPAFDQELISLPAMWQNAIRP